MHNNAKARKSSISDNALLAIFLFAVGFLTYVSGFSNDFLWDDHAIILQNRFIHDWSYVPQFFTENFLSGAGIMTNYYRPFLLIVYTMGWGVWQASPSGFHALSAGLHAIAAILFFFLVLRLSKKREIAFFTSLLFLVHPLQAEAVSYASGLGTPLATIFFFASTIYYLRWLNAKDNEPIFASLLLFVVSLLTNEIAIILPLFLVAIEFVSPHISLKKNSNYQTILSTIFKRLWPYFLIAITYIALRMSVLNFSFISATDVYAISNLPLTERVLAFLQVLPIYFALPFLPAAAYMEQSAITLAPLFSVPTIVGFLLAFSLLLFAFFGRRKYPLMSLGLFLYFIGLIPASNIFATLNGPLFEQWLYLPLAGLTLAIVSLLVQIVKQLRTPRQKSIVTKSLSVAGMLLALLFITLTVQRNTLWGDAITFSKEALRSLPNSYKAMNELGREYERRGELSPAMEIYTKAITSDPSNPLAHFNLGSVHVRLTNYAPAEDYYRRAIEADPLFVPAYEALATLYNYEAKYEEEKKLRDRVSLVRDARIAISRGEIPSALATYKVLLESYPQSKRLQARIRLLENR